MLTGREASSSRRLTAGGSTVSTGSATMPWIYRASFRDCFIDLNIGERTLLSEETG